MYVDQPESVTINRLQRLKGFAQLIRLPNLFTAASNIFAAHVVVTGAAPQWALLTLTLFASLCFYHAGMVLNDCCDYDEDRLARASRPLPSGLISLPSAWCTAVFLLLAGLTFCLMLGMTSFLIGCGLTAAIVFYNFSSRDGVLGCMAMGVCRSLNWCLGLSVLPGLLLYWHYAFFVGLYVFALTMISRDETHAHDSRWVDYCRGVMIVAMVLFGGVSWANDSFSLLNMAVLLLGLGVILQRLSMLKRQYNPENIQSTVMFLVLGLIPLDAVMVFMAGYPASGILILLLIIPSKILARKLYVT